MAWVAVEPPAAEMTLKANGDLEWNSALQILLSNPPWVHLMWDSDNSWLGIRGHDATGGGFPVSKNESTGTFTIDTSAVLAALGVSANPAHTETPPATWGTASLDPLFNDWYVVYYLTIP